MSVTPTPTPAPFATVEDLFVRLGATTPVNPSTAYNQAIALLDDASHELRNQIGQAIDPGTLVWTTRVPVGRRIAVPAVPITEVASVAYTEDSGQVEFTVEDAHTICVDATPGAQVTITYDYGWATVPTELKRWTLVLAAASITAAKAGNLGLSGGIAGVGVDDGRISFATNPGEQGQGVTIPPVQLAAMRARYGQNALVVEHQP